jgi:hypothetical protein
MRPLHVNRRVGVAVLVTLSALVLITGCGGSGGSESSARSRSTSTESTRTTDPTETTRTTDPTDTDDPTRFAFGQEVRIVDGAVVPQLLAADVKRPVVIRNTSSSVQEVVFTNPGWDEANTVTTGPIPPGGTFEVRPVGVVSITFTLAGTEARGVIQFEDQIG